MKKLFKQYRSAPSAPKGFVLDDVPELPSGFSLDEPSETPKKKELSHPSTSFQLPSTDTHGGAFYGSAPSASATQSTLKKRPTEDLADYAKNLNDTYSSIIAPFAGSPSPIQPKPTGTMLDRPNDPINQQAGIGDNPLIEKQKKDREEEDKIRNGDVNAIVGFTKRVQSSLAKTYNTKPFDVNDAAPADDPNFFANQMQQNEKISASLNTVKDKASTAIDYTVGRQAASLPTLDDSQKQDLGERLRKAKSDIGMGEDLAGVSGNYASDLLKTSFKPSYSLEEIQSHLQGEPPTTDSPIEWSDWNKWKRREKDYLENVKNTQMFRYKNEAEVNRAMASFYNSQMDDMATSTPSVTQYLQGDDATKRSLSGDENVKKFLHLYDKGQKIIQGQNDVIRKYPQAAKDIQGQLMTEAYAEDFVNKDAITPFFVGTNINPIYLKRFFVGQKADTEDEIKAIAQATGFSEDEVRKQAGNIKLPSYAGEIVRGGANMLASQFQWLNRKLLPANEGEVRNAQIDNSIYQTPRALQLTSGNINPETVFRTMANGFGQFVAFAAEGYLGGEVLGAAGIGAVRGAQAIGEGTGLTEGVFSNAPKIGRIFNFAGEFLSDSGAAAEGSAIERVAGAGERARELAATYAAGHTSSYESAYKEAQQYSSDPAKWAEYADASAFLNGISELVLPDVDVAKKMLAVRGVKSLLKNGVVELSKPALATSYMAELGKIIGQETLEEYIPLVGQTLEKSKIFNYQTSTSDFYKQLWETTLQTAISTVPMAVFGSHGSNSSHFTKSTLYEVAQQPEKYGAMIDRMRDQGQMPNEVANERKKMVNTLNDIYSKIPATDKNGKELSESAKQDLVADIFKQRWNENQKATTDKSVHAPFNKNINEAQDGINTVMEGNHVEPVEVSTMRDNLDNQPTSVQPTTSVTEQLNTTTATGDIVNNILSDIFENDINLSNETPPSQTQGQQSEETRSGDNSNVNTPQSESVPTEEAASQQSGDNSNRAEASANQTLQERLDAARASIPESQPTMQDNSSEARRAEERRQQREEARKKRNQIIDEQTQAEPNKVINVSPAAETSNTVNIVSEAPSTLTSNEITPADAERRNVPGVFRFGEVQNIPIDQISNSDGAFRGRRNVSREAIRYFRKNNTNEPVMVYRHENGKVYVLDGRARLEAKRANRRKTVPVRFFNGTAEEARQYADLQRPAPQADQLQKRIARVTMNDPKSFEEAVLQRMLSKNGFNRGDFARTMGFGYVNRNRNSIAYGRTIGLNDIRDAVSNGILRSKGTAFDQFAQDWIQRNEAADSGVRGFGSEQDLANQIGDIIMSHQTREAIVNRLEELNGIQGQPLQNTALPFNVTDQEATFIAENNLSSAINSILNNALDIELTKEEQTAYENLVQSNANDDGTLDIDTIFNELTASSDPALVSLRNKLSRYATTEEAISKSFGDTGREAVFETQNEDFFSRGIGEATALTPKQAKTLGNAFRKVFGSKPFNVFVDDRFFEVLPLAIAKFSKQLSEQAAYYMDQLGSAQTELQTARNELNAKRRQLDRNIGQDQEDLFGGRPSDAQNLLFNERVDLSARNKALKPFEDRVVNAQQRVTQLQDKITKIAKQAPEQQSLFSRIPFKRRLNNLVQLLRENKEKIGGVYMEMLDEDAEGVIKFIADQYHDPDSRGGVVRQVGETIAGEAARLFPKSSTDDRPLLSRNGEVYGMVYNGDVYMNPSAVRSDTPLHEIGGHILTAWAKQNQPELYNKIIAVAKQVPEELLNQVRKNYPELSDVQDSFWEEAFATFVGLDARNLSRANEFANLQGLSAIRQAIKDIWNDFVNFLIDKGIFKPTASFNADDFREMTLSDFSNMVGEKMFEGRRLSAPAYDLKSIPEFANLSDNVLLHDNWGNPIALLPAGEQQVANAKVAERNKDIKNNTFKIDPRFQRIGVESNLTPHQQANFKVALEMEGQGESPESMFLATGWFRDPADKRMKYELPNDNVRFLIKQNGSLANEWFANRGVYPVQVDKLFAHRSVEEREKLKEIARTQAANLEDLLEYPELYEAHPELRTLRVNFKKMDKAYGQYLPNEDEINIHPDISAFDMYLTLRHEVQHALQHRLNFETGANMDSGARYYYNKLSFEKNTLDNLRAAHTMAVRSGTIGESHINFLLKRISEQENKIKELNEAKDGLIYLYYTSFAGEQEANAVMERGRLPDAIRMLTPPEIKSRESVITYGDNLAIKQSLEIGPATEEYSAPNELNKYESLEFGAEGGIKYDRIKQLRDEIRQTWNESQKATATADRQKNNMQMYGSLLNLADEYLKSGRANISDLFASGEFAKLFGVDKYEDLPQQIKARLTNILQMTQAQRQIVQQQIDGALKAGGDVQKNLSDRLNAMRNELANAATQQDATGQKPRMRFVYNEQSEKWEQAPVGDKQADAREQLDSMLTEVPGGDEVKKYLSGETIERAYGNAPENNQDYEMIKLQDALDHGRNIIETAKRAFGVYYAEPMLDFISKSSSTPSIKSLMYVSLENSLAQDRMDQPGRDAEIAKMQSIVYEQSQAFARSVSLALNYNRLRNIAFNGYTTEQATNQMLTDAEVKQRKGVEKAVEANADRVNQEADAQQNTTPDEQTIAANAEATEREKAAKANESNEVVTTVDTKLLKKKPIRKKSSKGTWEKKAEEKGSLKERLAQLKQDIANLNC
jgi:hypothetical protein